MYECMLSKTRICVYGCIGLVNRTIAFCGVIGIGNTYTVTVVPLLSIDMHIKCVCMYVCMYLYRGRLLVLK